MFNFFKKKQNNSSTEDAEKRARVERLIATTKRRREEAKVAKKNPSTVNETVMSLDELFKVYKDIDPIIPIALKKIKSSDRTENILIRSTGFEETDPYIETMYIIGDYTLPEIQEMVKELTPSEVYENWMYGKPVNAPEPNGKVFSIWWD